MKHLFLSCFVNCALCIFLFSGCGGDSSRPKDLPPLFPVTLTVTQEGKPLADATVSLAAGDGAKYSSSGTTNDNGTAVLQTYGYSGVPKGKYKVMIAKQVDENLRYGEDNGTGSKPLIAWDVFSYVESKFAAKETTPLEIEITSRTEQTFDAGKAVKIKSAEIKR